MPSRSYGYSAPPPVSYSVSDNTWPAARSSSLSFEEEKKRVLAAAGKEATPGRQRDNSDDSESALVEKPAPLNEKAQKEILDSLREIKEKIEQKEDHPSLVRASGLLKLNDFSEKYSEKMLGRLKKELPLDTLNDIAAVEDTLVKWIGESIGIYSEHGRPKNGKVMVLVGPTGVGKTTTIAKLAAIYGVGSSGRKALKVRMITIDAFRIGARAQFESYGNIMMLPVSYVDSRQKLKKEIALYSEDTDLFLVDTIGNSPRNSAKLGEMKEFLDGCGRNAEIHLALSASTKTSDIEEILRQFEPFNYRSVLLTKMDETIHIGNVISALSERGKPVSYITDGQTVPSDIYRASVSRFLTCLEDFKIDRQKTEKLFPAGEDHFQWS
jgi:flagellar biosynthesis protein FlhF